MKEMETISTAIEWYVYAGFIMSVLVGVYVGFILYKDHEKRKRKR